MGEFESISPEVTSEVVEELKEGVHEDVLSDETTGERLTLEQLAARYEYGNYRSVEQILKQAGISKVDSIPRKGNKPAAIFLLDKAKQVLVHQRLDRPPGLATVETIIAFNGASLRFGSMNAWVDDGKVANVTALRTALEEYQVGEPASLPSRYVWSGVPTAIWTEDQVDPALEQYWSIRGLQGAEPGYIDPKTREQYEAIKYWMAWYHLDRDSLKELINSIGAEPQAVHRTRPRQPKYYSRHVVHAAYLFRESHRRICFVEPGIHPATGAFGCSAAAWGEFLNRDHVYLRRRLVRQAVLGTCRTYSKGLNNLKLFTPEAVRAVDPEAFDQAEYLLERDDQRVGRHPAINEPYMFVPWKVAQEIPARVPRLLAKPPKGPEKTFYRLADLRELFGKRFSFLWPKSENFPRLQPNPGAAAEQRLQALRDEAFSAIERGRTPLDRDGLVQIDGITYAPESLLIDEGASSLEELEQLRKSARWQEGRRLLAYVVWKRYWKQPVLMYLYEYNAEQEGLRRKLIDLERKEQRERQQADLEREAELVRQRREQELRLVEAEENRQRDLAAQRERIHRMQQDEAECRKQQWADEDKRLEALKEEETGHVVPSTMQERIAEAALLSSGFGTTKGGVVFGIESRWKDRYRRVYPEIERIPFQQLVDEKKLEQYRSSEGTKVYIERDVLRILIAILEFRQRQRSR